MTSFWQILRKTKILAILRGDLDEPEKVLEALWQGGLRTVEITTNSPRVFSYFKSLSQKFQGKLILGMGTVYDSALCQKSLSAGAKFIVAPNINREVIGLCQKNKVPVIPGVMTPTEVGLALALGTKTVKLFPASIFPNYLQQLKKPFDQVSFIPVGGINLGNAKSFFKAGAFALGIGGGLLDKEYLKNKDWDKITQKTRAFLKIAK